MKKNITQIVITFRKTPKSINIQVTLIVHIIFGRYDNKPQPETRNSCQSSELNYLLTEKKQQQQKNNITRHKTLCFTFRKILMELFAYIW